LKSILFASHSASRTGAPILLLDIAALLAARGHKCSFVVGEDGPLIPEFEKIGPTFIEPLYPDELKYWRELKRASRRIAFLKETNPDLFYCNTIHPVKWLVYACFLGIPTLTHVHELSMGFATLSGLEHAMLRNFSQRYIAVSGAVKEYLVSVQHISHDKIDVVRAGIKLDRFDVEGRDNAIRRELGFESAVVVGTVGRITPMKGSDFFLEVAATIKRRIGVGVKLKFLVVATTDDKEFYLRFRKHLDASELRNDFIILENVDNVAAYYSAMDIYVSTAREDPFPLVILEAMAAKKLVVAFATGGIPEMVTPETGVLIKGLDVTAMASALLDLIAKPEMRTAMGEAARKRVVQQFDLQQNISQIERIIDA
jgi:glycosyltransferase involved in cell wall biosynthesis